MLRWKTHSRGTRLRSDYRLALIDLELAKFPNIRAATLLCPFNICALQVLRLLNVDPEVGLSDAEVLEVGGFLQGKLPGTETSPDSATVQARVKYGSNEQPPEQGTAADAGTVHCIICFPHAFCCACRDTVLEVGPQAV